MVSMTIPNVYSTPYTECNGDSCVQRTVTLPGNAGKIITIDSLSLNLQISKSGAEATAWVTSNVNGTPEVLANWTEKLTSYKPKTATPKFAGEVGKPVTLKWHLKTSNSAVRARMNELALTYTVAEVPAVDVEIEDPVVDIKEPTYLVVIECESKDEAAEIVRLSNLRTDLYTRKTM